VVNCKGPGLPSSVLLDLKTLKIRELERNKNIRKLLPAPLKKSIYLKIGKANVELILPIGISLNSSVSLPALLHVYGGPGTQEVDYQWYDNTILLTNLAQTNQIIGIKVDVRGSGYGGAKYKMSVYRNLGTKEVDDVIKIIKILKKKYQIIDPKRLGVFGWSYGGYFSLSLLARDATNEFMCGVSVAPVAMWQLYDSAYTERYMSTPEDNPTGYNNSIPLWNLKNLRGKEYLLLHGTNDDNVHLQNSMFISQQLEKQNIKFRAVIYPDQNHSIPNYLLHVFLTMAEFFTSCLNYN